MWEYTDELVGVFKFFFKYRYTFVSLFDCHAKYPEGASNVNVMKVYYNGKQEAKLQPARIHDGKSPREPRT